MASLKFASIGLGYGVQVNRVDLILPPDTMTTKQKVKQARDAGYFIDASRGRKFRSVLMMQDGVVVASAISPSTLIKRFAEDISVNYMDELSSQEGMEDYVFDPEETSE